MKIAFFTDTFLPLIDGIASSTANLAYELGKKGHHVSIFTPKIDHISRPSFRAKNVTIIPLPSVPMMVYPEYRLSMFGLPKVLKFLKEINPDIIHFQTPMTVGFDALIAARILDKPLVGSFHPYLTNPEFVGWIKNKMILKGVGDFVLMYCRFFASSCSLRLSPSKLLIKGLYKAGYNSPIEYLPNPLRFDIMTTSVTPRQRDALKHTYSLNKKVVLYFGRLSGEKRIGELVQSFAVFAREYTDSTLLLVGDGPERTRLERQAKKTGLANQIVFTGIIPHQELLRSGLLPACDVFASASAMETQSMSVLESMAAGLPIIGVKKAGMIELVTKNGLLVKPGDIQAFAGAMKTILLNDDIYKDMSFSSRKKALDFSSDKVADRLLGFYNKLLIKQHRL